MANDIVYIFPNPGGSTDGVHVIGVGECIEFHLTGASCEVQFSVEPSSTNPRNLPHTTDWVYKLPPNSSDPLDSVYQFYFKTPGTITYWVNPGGQGVPGGGHTVIVGSVGLEGR